MVQAPALRSSQAPGFTLLEVMIVIFLLALLAALAVPSLGIVDDKKRTELTQKRMEQIRAALLGSAGVTDAAGRPVIGGYVGDMHAWPDLWEARAEMQPSTVGVSWDTPSSLTGKNVGQGPNFLMNPGLVFFRPSGHFSTGRWRWNRPFRKLSDDPQNHDHIGGLETENEGQPRGLWTRYVEDLPFDLDLHPAPGVVLGADWRGPYIVPPVDPTLADATHLAQNDNDYAKLEPLWLPSQKHESWEDGDKHPTGGLGEHFDDKEAFRLLQTEDRLCDGWNRAFRFFITQDPDSPDDTLFWILSEGADGSGAYPSKGTCTGWVWSVNNTDTMSAAYDPNHPANKDNLVLRLSSRQWRQFFADQDARKTRQTEILLKRVRHALVGKSPWGKSSGYTADMGTWPPLFGFDNATKTWTAEHEGKNRTCGQPRGLWEKPAGAADITQLTARGFGWRYAYIAPPHDTGANNCLQDAWGRPLLFLQDTAHDALLILSRGRDGTFFLDGKEQTEPDPVQNFDVLSYAPDAEQNRDNRHILIHAPTWKHGIFRLAPVVVTNATTSTKAGFYPVNATMEICNATTFIPANATHPARMIFGTNETQAFDYSDTSKQHAIAGERILLFWVDTNANNIPDTTEKGLLLPQSVTVMPEVGQHGPLMLNTSGFYPLP